MSHYNKIKTKIKSKDALKKALQKMGFKENMIQDHDEAQHLTGYAGKQRPEKANIIIDRQYVGGAANDLGWELQEDGTYQAIISDYDKRRYNDKWCQDLEQHCSIEQAKETFELHGWSYTEQTNEEGEYQLVGVTY